MESEAVLGSMDVRLWPREVDTVQVHQLAVQRLCGQCVCVVQVTGTERSLLVCSDHSLYTVHSLIHWPMQYAFSCTSACGRALNIA